MFRIRRLPLILVLLLAIVGGLFLYRFEYKDEQIKNQELYKESEKLNKKMRELRKEKELLNSELNDLYDELYVGDMGSTIILITDTQSDCLDDAIYHMNNYNYKGVIVLDYNHLPDDNKKGYLNREQIDELVEDGFEIVIKAESEDVPITYEKFKALGYDIKGIYFDQIVVTSLMAEQIYDLDPNMVIIGNYLDSIGITDTLLINYYGSRQQNVKTLYQDAIDKSKVIALTVGYENSSSRYDEDNFVSMLKTIRENVIYDKTSVCVASEAIVRNQQYLSSLEEINPDKYTRVEELKKRISEIGKELIDMDFN